MKMSKKVLTLVTAAVLSTSTFAAMDNDNDSPSEKMYTAKAGVAALSKTLVNMGQEVDTTVDLTGLRTYAQKTEAYNSKHAELQEQFDASRS